LPIKGELSECELKVESWAQRREKVEQKNGVKDTEKLVNFCN